MARVTNDLLADGCTLADLLARCRATATSRSAYLSCVWQLLSQWRAQGIITGKEASRILKCVVRNRDHDSQANHQHSSRDDHSDSPRGHQDPDGGSRGRNHGRGGKQRDW